MEPELELVLVEPLCLVEVEDVLREVELPDCRVLWAESSIPPSDSMRAIAVTAIVENCRIFFMTNNF